MSLRNLTDPSTKMKIRPAGVEARRRARVGVADIRAVDGDLDLVERVDRVQRLEQGIACNAVGPPAITIDVGGLELSVVRSLKMIVLLVPS